MNEREEKGLQVFADVLGKDMADAARHWYETTEDFGKEQARWTMEFPYGTIWTRAGLERRNRSFTVLGMLIGLRAHEEIKVHTRIALANGITRQELEEVFYTALPYVGFPNANVAKAAMIETFAEIDAAAGE